MKDEAAVRESIIFILDGYEFSVDNLLPGEHFSFTSLSPAMTASMANAILSLIKSTNAATAAEAYRAGQRDHLHKIVRGE